MYVGQTRNLRARIAQHQRQPPARMRADVAALVPWEQHFVVRRLQTASTQRRADGLERAYIAQLGAMGPQGYNKLDGPPGRSTRGQAVAARARQRRGQDSGEPRAD